MAEKILIMGESGTGKSTSIRNCDPAITAIVNPVGKPLPFKGSKHFAQLNGVTDSDEICNFMKTQAAAGKKIIIVDDFQYILAIPYMDRIKETGWDKYNDFGANYFKIIDICNELPGDVCVYYLTHCETLENGVTTVKLIGKLLREKITVEGLFTIVLKTGTSEGKYYFFTQNSGKDTVKSPLGMFDSFSIDNDLAYVDSKIRNYYEFDNAVSDAEIAKLDQEKAGTVEKPEPRRRRGSHTVEAEKEEASKPEISENDATGNTGSEETNRPVSHRRSHTEAIAESEQQKEATAAAVEEMLNVPEGEPEEKVVGEKVDEPKLPEEFTRTAEPESESNDEQPVRRRRRVRDENNS